MRKFWNKIFVMPLNVLPGFFQIFEEWKQTVLEEGVHCVDKLLV